MGHAGTYVGKVMWVGGNLITYLVCVYCVPVPSLHSFSFYFFQIYINGYINIIVMHNNKIVKFWHRLMIWMLLRNEAASKSSNIQN